MSTLSPPVRRARAAALVLVGALALGGCGGSDDKQSAPRPPTAPATVKTRATLVHVTGRLKPAARTAITTKVGSMVDAWFDAAYVGGDYPRAAASFRDAFPGFTAAAAAQARRNLTLMTNADLGPKVDGVTPQTKAVRLDVLAAKGRAVGVTARVWLSYRTSGSFVSKQLVRGQLDLAKVGRAWQVFAFTITKTRRPMAGSAPSTPSGPAASGSASTSGGATS